MSRKSGTIPPGEGEILANEWEKVVEERQCFLLDVAKVKHLIFDTYQYFCKHRDYNSVLRKDLEIYKCVCIFSALWEEYPSNCEKYAFDVCLDFAEGLCYAIENGFPRGYVKDCLHLGLTYHIPAGGAAPEADMSSYETYEKRFRKELVVSMREHIDDDELDEQEELKKIAESRDERCVDDNAELICRDR